MNRIITLFVINDCLASRIVDVDWSYFVTPGIAPVEQAFDRFKLLMTLLLPVLGKPKNAHLYVIHVGVATANCN